MPDANDILREKGKDGLRDEFDRAHAKRKASNGADSDPPPLPFASFKRFDQESIPMREWIVPDRFPRRHVGLISGEGGAGKSIILLQLAVACVLGRDWLRSVPEKGPVLAFVAEDEEIEIARRLKPILDFYGARFADLDNKLHVFPCIDRRCDPLLANADRDGLVVPTPLYSELMGWAERIKPVLIIVDNVADVYGGSEIDRSQVRQFVSLMQRPAIAANASLLMTAHPSLTGISTKTGLSGSTGWHNSVRGRAYLHGLEGENADQDLRVLEFKKSNYSRVSEQVELKWRDGLFVPIPRKSFIEEAAANATADGAFNDCFDHAYGNVSPNPAARNYAPRVFAQQAEAKKAGVTEEMLEAAMHRLLATGAIKTEEYGPPSKRSFRIVRGR